MPKTHVSEGLRNVENVTFCLVILREITVEVDNPDVDDTSTLTVGLTRVAELSDWNPNKCFVLDTTVSVYGNNAKLYSSFDHNKPPVCKPL